MKVLCIVQARTTSTRLPGKVLLPIAGVPMIIFQLNRLVKCKRVDELVLATSSNTSDNDLANRVSTYGYKVFRGDLNDVLKRYQQCCLEYDGDIVVRITGDCPLMDPTLIDELIGEFQMDDSCDYLTNCGDDNNLSVPDGMDIEVFTVQLLKKMNQFATLKSEREHVTPWARKNENKVRWKNYGHRPKRDYYRLTVDDSIDYYVVKTIAEKLQADNCDFGVDEIITYLKERDNLGRMNINTERNEGYRLSVESDRIE